ncbi:MAG TPA: hypothetical protein VFG76_06010, partial [Candidatus Polarisedimenticolia bacterium]|nr:hypothetical protein [Candidatus Polarisedimenticolia bacterium]
MSRNAAAFVCALAGVCVISFVMGLSGRIPYQDPVFAQFDHNSYLAIASEGVGAPGRASVPPFCWRILTPLIARALPLPLPTAFFAISFAALVGSAWGMYHLLAREGLPHRHCVAGQIAFLSCFWAFGFNLWSYIMVDAVCLVIIVAGLLILGATRWSLKARQAAMALLMALGALNKESVLVLGAAAAVYLWSNT